MSENETEKKQLKTFEIEDILDALPHRYPMLMVDRIIEMDRDESCIGIKNVTYNEPIFTGHFPENPIMPGVLLIEGMAQTAGALCVSSRDVDTRPKVVYFLTIDKAKFRAPIRPGQVVEYHMKKLKQRGSMWWFKGTVIVNGKICVEAEVSAMLAEEA